MTSITQSTAVDVKDLILDISPTLGLVFGTDLFVGRMPEDAGVAVGVFDISPDRPPEFGFSHEYPSVQVLVQGYVYTEIYEMAVKIRDHIYHSDNKVINGVNYIGFWVLTDILPLGYDENERIRFIVDFNIQRNAI